MKTRRKPAVDFKPGVCAFVGAAMCLSTLAARPGWASGHLGHNRGAIIQWRGFGAGYHNFLASGGPVQWPALPKRRTLVSSTGTSLQSYGAIDLEKVPIVDHLSLRSALALYKMGHPAGIQWLGQHIVDGVMAAVRSRSDKAVEGLAILRPEATEPVGEMSPSHRAALVDWVTSALDDAGLLVQTIPLYHDRPRRQPQGGVAYEAAADAKRRSGLLKPVWIGALDDSRHAAERLLVVDDVVTTGGVAVANAEAAIHTLGPLKEVLLFAGIDTGTSPLGFAFEARINQTVVDALHADPGALASRFSEVLSAGEKPNPRWRDFVSVIAEQPRDLSTAFYRQLSEPAWRVLGAMGLAAVPSAPVTKTDWAWGH